MTKILIDCAVVEQSLEALRCVDLQSLVPDYGSGHYSVARLDGPQVKSAITAMEAALAEPTAEESSAVKPVQEPDDGGCDGLRGGLCIHQDPSQCKPERDCPAFSASPQRPAEPVQDHFPDATKMVQEPVAQAIQDAVVYGVGISHGGKRIDPDSICKKAQPVQEPVACLIGTKGSAFDLPTTKRAYTYAKQPGNVVASRLGLACDAAASQSAGDSIDCGLGLLQELQRQGFGVFDLGAEYTAPPQRKPLTDEEIERLWYPSAVIAEPGKRRVAFGRAVERAHGIGVQP